MPPIVLAHGVGSTFAHNWVDMGWVDILTDLDRTVIPFELPGHGAASNRPLAENETTTSRVWEAIDGQPAVDGVGFSAGAMALLTAACADPGRFRRLALLGIGDGFLSPDLNAGHRLAAVLDSPDEPEDVVDRVFWRLPEAAGNTRPAVAAYLRVSRDPIEPADLAAVRCPVLLVVGERDFVGAPERLLAALPDASLVTLPRTDHFATTSNWTCIEAVTKFLDD